MFVIRFGLICQIFIWLCANIIIGADILMLCRWCNLELSNLSLSYGKTYIKTTFHLRNLFDNRYRSHCIAQPLCFLLPWSCMLVFMLMRCQKNSVHDRFSRTWRCIQWKILKKISEVLALLQDGDNISVGGYIVPLLIHSPILNFSFTSLSDLFKKVIIVLIFQKETKADSIFSLYCCVW